MVEWIFVENEDIPKKFLCEKCKHEKNFDECICFSLGKVKDWDNPNKNLKKYDGNERLFKCNKGYWIIIKD